MAQRQDTSDREALPGTVKYYERHLIVCTGQTVWPARIQSGGGFPQALDEAISARLDALAKPVKMTACSEVSHDGGHDILVFPDAVRYLAVTEDDLPALVEDHLVGGRVSDRIPHEPLDGHHVFVCIHANRDQRCGMAGPPIMMRFREEIAARDLSDVSVYATSHVGGHRFAGNVLVYPGGDWYGYVTPDDVPTIIEAHIEAGSLVRELWRGSMATTRDEQLARAKEWYDDTAE